MKKELFKKFSQQHESLPFSLQYNWWNEVVQQEWDIALVENQGEVKAIWPYTINKSLGFIQLRTADFTPYTGPFIVYPDGQKNHRKYSFEKKILEELLLQFPKYHSFEQNCHLGFENTLPLIWKSWKQSTRYTYILENIGDLKQTYAGFADNIRREIKKAEKDLVILQGEDILPVLEMMESTFSAQGMKMPAQKQVFKAIQNYMNDYSCGKIYYAKSSEQKTVAAIAIIWDHNSAYYLMGGADNAFKNSGAMSLLMWTAIQFSSSKVGTFNFEGSMIPGIERFFRGFGGELVPYHHLSHSNSTLLQFLKKLKN